MDTRLNYTQFSALVTKEQLEELYPEHTINWITEHFNVKYCGIVRQLFRDLGIKIFHRGGGSKISIDYEELKKQISYDELYNYYVTQCNSHQKCAEHFGVTPKVMYKLICAYDIHKTKDEKFLTDCKSKEEKYGNPYYNNAKQISKAMKSAYEEHGDEIVKKRKTTKLEKYGDENYTGEGGFYHCQYKDQDIIFDSLPELALWRYAIDHCEDIERIPLTLKFEFEGVQHTYKPDFRYKGELIEIKGDHMVNEDGVLFDVWGKHRNDDFYRAKYNCAIENGVRFMLTNEYKKFVDYFNSNYNKNDFIRKEANN